MDSMIAGTSNGLMDLRFNTSAETPYFSFTTLAASRQKTRFLECETMVTSEPSSSILALPIGKTKSGEAASSDIGKDSPYNSSFSKKTTGLGSLIAALRRPLQSSEENGEITFKPGIDPYQAE
ncbi:hypothetical protein OGATHE_002776 [Ogataea polymorpha]|uniref:Uncharacterized protein n=1 Tax=Ogataea polymorpha TaxID=460523 RepID=A0A9P8T876_9ASCO|nr:hypothetical protein OGATHE_002776 [Ogataea polymorpha]